MSDSRAFRAVAAWVLIPLGVLLFYVLSWPPIEIKATKGAYSRHFSALPSMPPGLTVTTRTGRGRFTHYAVVQWPTWFYAPLHRLRYAEAKNNPVDTYYEWWAGLLK